MGKFAVSFRECSYLGLRVGVFLHQLNYFFMGRCQDGRSEEEAQSRRRATWLSGFFVVKKTQLMVTCWFGARWFGFLKSPYERACYLGVPRFESLNHRDPNQQAKPFVEKNQQLRSFMMFHPSSVLGFFQPISRNNLFLVPSE